MGRVIDFVHFTTEGGGTYVIETTAVDWDHDQQRARRRIGSITTGDVERNMVELTERYISFPDVPEVGRQFTFHVTGEDVVWATSRVRAINETSELMTEPRGGRSEEATA